MVRPILLATLCSGGILMLGCSVFIERVVVLPERAGATERRAFDEAAKVVAVGIGSQVATANGLSLVPRPHTRLSGEEYDIATIFQKKGRVWLSVLIKDDQSEIVFVITDQRHGEETEFTAALRRDLMRELALALPGAEVKYEYKSERGSLMAP